MTRPLSLAALLLFAGPAAATADDAANRAAIEGMTAEQRAALLGRHEAFLALPAAERARLRALHAALDADGPAGELNRTLDRLRDVLGRLTPAERAAVDGAPNAAAKVAALRKALDAYRRIPPPPAGGDRDAFRAAFAWPQRDLIVDQLADVLSERASLAVTVGGDPRDLPTADRLLAVVRGPVSTRAGTLKSPDAWLPDDVLTALDRRLADRGLPGLDAWLQRDGTAQIARRKLSDLLGTALRDAWATRVAGRTATGSSITTPGCPTGTRCGPPARRRGPNWPNGSSVTTPKPCPRRSPSTTTSGRDAADAFRHAEALRFNPGRRGRRPGPPRGPGPPSRPGPPVR